MPRVASKTRPKRSVPAELEKARRRTRLTPGSSPAREAAPRKRKAAARPADSRVMPGSGDSFVDLGFEPAEARVMALRVQLMAQLSRHLTAQGTTQLEMARLLGTTQPRVSMLLNGIWKDFSIDMLLILALRAGLRPEVRLAP